MPARRRNPRTLRDPRTETDWIMWARRRVEQAEEERKAALREAEQAALLPVRFHCATCQPRIKVPISSSGRPRFSRWRMRHTTSGALTANRQTEAVWVKQRLTSANSR